MPEGKNVEDILDNFAEAKERIEQIDGTTNPNYTPTNPGSSSSGGSSGGGSGSNNNNDNTPPPNPGDETGEYFDAGLLEVPERYGYVKLNLFNQGDYKVKYLVVDISESHKYVGLKAGDEVPESAIEYQSGDEFILWTSSEVFAYQVDNNDTIIEPVKVNKMWHNFPIDFEVNQESAKLKIKVLVDPTDKKNEQLLENVYLFSSEDAFKLDLSKGSWTKVDEIPTIELTLDSEVDPTNLYQVFVEGYHFNALTYINYDHESLKEESEKIGVVLLKYAAEKWAMN